MRWLIPVAVAAIIMAFSVITAALGFGDDDVHDLLTRVNWGSFGSALTVWLTRPKRQEFTS